MIDRATRWTAGAGGVFFALGGPLHPNPEPGVEDLDAVMQGQLDASNWVISHALLLVSYVFMTAALVLLVRRLRLGGSVLWLGRVAAAGAVLGVVEMAFHLASVTEADALRAGTSTPVIDTHVAMAAVVYPVWGIALGAFIAVLGWRRQLTNPVIATIGAIGSVLFAIAPPLILITGDPDWAGLYPFTTLLVVWLLAVAFRPELGVRDRAAFAVA